MNQPAFILFKIIKIMVSKPFSARSTILVIAIILFVVQVSTAQYSRRRSGSENSWEVGFSGGASQFLTSINPNSDAPYKKFNYWNADYNAAITLSVIRNFSPKFSAEFEFLTTKLSGTWNKNNPYGIPLPATAQNLPAPFKTGINQYVLMFVPNLNKIFAPDSPNEKWYLFVKGGFGAAILKEYSGLYLYTPSNKFKYTIAYGGGLSYAINEKIKLKLGTTWYRVETDRLDGFHTVRPGITVITKDADLYFNVKERYIYPYIGLTYGFGQIVSKAHFMQRRNSMSLWFKPSAHKNKRRR